MSQLRFDISIEEIHFMCAIRALLHTIRKLRNCVLLNRRRVREVIDSRYINDLTVNRALMWRYEAGDGDLWVS